MPDPTSIAYDRGYRDFRYKDKQTKNGVTTYVTKFNLVCPFKEGSFFAKEWQRGQNAHYFENLKYLQSYNDSKSIKPVPNVAEIKGEINA